MEPDTSGTTMLKDGDVLRRARLLRATSGALEVVIALVVSGSVAAMASVHPWAYVPLWFGCGLALLLALGRGALAGGLRRRLGARAFAFHPSGKWLMGAEDAYGLSGWRFDLGQPRLPHPPLLVPGLLFGGLVLLQLAPLPLDGAGRAWRTITLSIDDTLRGFGFLASALALHIAAAGAFDKREARERFRKVVTGLGTAVALVALLQTGAGATRIYWFYQPEQADTAWGPFVNRNHLAGYMLLVVPVCLDRLFRAFRRYAASLGNRTRPRRILLGLGRRQGSSLVLGAIPAMACIGALIATTSRGALLSLVGALVLVAVGLRTRSGLVPAWLLAALLAMPLSWYGLERLDLRFGRTAHDAPGRVLIWQEAIERVKPRWLTGSGYNTFAVEFTRVAAWALPEGATAWPPEVRAKFESGVRVGYRTPDGVAGLTWYGEAHNDYVQVLAETGVPGLLLALLAAFAVLHAARHDHWVRAALAAVLMHSFVDFDLQIPCIPVLFVCLAALAANRRPLERVERAGFPPGSADPRARFDRSRGPS